MKGTTGAEHTASCRNTDRRTSGVSCTGEPFITKVMKQREDTLKKLIFRQKVQLSVNTVNFRNKTSRLMESQKQPEIRVDCDNVMA